MKQIIHKAYWNYEKEEQWLNAMSAKGLALMDYWWIRYVFEDCAPGEYIYRIELLEHWATHPESRRYIEFVESTGAECVATYMRWAYFRKKAADGPFELYSDIPSKLRHYRMVRAFWVGLTILEYATGLFNVLVGAEEPVSSVNIVLGSLLVLLGAGFTMMIANLNRKIHSLKKTAADPGRLMGLVLDISGSWGGKNFRSNKRAAVWPPILVCMIFFCMLDLNLPTAG